MAARRLAADGFAVVTDVDAEAAETVRASTPAGGGGETRRLDVTSEAAG